jgi:hypothetical protein
MKISSGVSLSNASSGMNGEIRQTIDSFALSRESFKSIGVRSLGLRSSRVRWSFASKIGTFMMRPPIGGKLKYRFRF